LVPLFISGSDASFEGKTKCIRQIAPLRGQSHDETHGRTAKPKGSARRFGIRNEWRRDGRCRDGGFVRRKRTAWAGMTE
ncbi:hypothetical protein NX872_30765, partial [Burkholderia thailandensis]|uniref:hypothetical protein n=1 Tax=Burkholderia thailandensis TaxID=57975 RepID=UPI00217DCF58